MSLHMQGAMNIHINNEDDLVEYDVPIKRLDDVISEGESVTFIKMDIEGSEYKALEGARKIITKNKPVLAICIYHRLEHFLEIPLLIKSMNPEYNLIMRHHIDTTCDAVLYAY